MFLTIVSIAFAKEWISKRFNSFSSILIVRVSDMLRENLVILIPLVTGTSWSAVRFDTFEPWNSNAFCFYCSIVNVCIYGMGGAIPKR